MFWVNIADASNVTISDGPIITGTKWTYRQKLSQAGEWSLTVPTADPRLQDATLKRRVHCYIQVPNGQRIWLGGGIIESRGFGLSADDVSVMTLSGPDLLRELAGVTVNFTVSAATSAPRATAIFSAIFAAVPSWSVTIPSGLSELTARFVHESALNALVSTCEKVGAFFWMEPFTTTPRKVVIAASPVASEIIATNLADTLAVQTNTNVCLISDIERVESSWDAKNRLIVYGAGDGQARLTLASATLWPNGGVVTSAYAYTDYLGRSYNFVLDKATNTITNSTAVSAYGQDEAAVAFKDIAPITANSADMTAAANTLVTAAVNQIIMSSFPKVTYRLQVAALRTEVHPGLKIRVAARKVRDGYAYINIDEDLVITEVGYDVDVDGAKVTDLTVSTNWVPEKTGVTILSEAISKLNSMDAHPQIGANTDTLTYREDIDYDTGAPFPFWLSNGTLQINSVILRFKLEKLRSTAKTIGGTATGTVDIPNHSHSLTAHHHDTPHQHYSAIDPGSGGGTVQVFSGGGSPDYGSLVGNGLAHQIRISTNTDSTPTSDDNSSITVSGGATGGVSLDISSALSIEYGIYVDPGTAYAVNELDWTANGTAISATPTSIAGGFYEVDITSYLADANTARPLAYANVIAVAVKPATADHTKKVRITAQIELRTTIQTLAVV